MTTHLKYAYLALTLALPYVVFANPQGPNVVSGDVHIEHPDSKTMHIRAGEKAIVEWSNFSIDAGEKTKFIQPNSGSAILNRVKGKYPSSIFGRLEANGKVYLINPNGVLIGKGGVVTAGSFLASTHHLSNEDFLNGKEHHLKGDSREKVINYGSIQATDGDVVLVAHHVENSGSIEAIKGEVLIGAGNEVLIRPAGDDRVQIRLSERAETKEGTGIDQLGTIQAIRAQLQADGNLYALAINQEGIVQAEGSIEKDGQVYLVAEGGRSQLKGSLTAKNANGTGGEVRVLGDSVVLVDQAKIDVSGNAGGGTVLIGGDYQGKNPEIMNSSLTWIGDGAKIDASALDSGNGGRVIVWSDGATLFRGNIRMEGGRNGGDGGFAEISGKQDLAFQGLVSAFAPQGNTGNLLLDPCDITIISFGTTTGSFSGCGTPPDTFIPTMLPATLQEPDLINQMNSTSCNVLVSATNDICFATNTAVLYTSVRTLTLDAGGNINFADGAILQNSADGPIVLQAGLDISMISTSSSRIATSGFINLTAGGDCDFSCTGLARGVFIEMQNGLSISAGGDINLTGTMIENTGTGNANISLVANGNINLMAGSIPTSIRTNGRGGTGSITLAVDNASSRPNIGTGTLSVDSTTSITTDLGSTLSIYAARQSLEEVAIVTPGTQFNGDSFFTGTVGTNVSTPSGSLQWNTYYGDPVTGSFPFTFFYEETSIPTPTPTPTPSPSSSSSPTPQQIAAAVATVQTVGFVSTASPSTSSAAVVQSYNPFTNFHIQLPDSLVFSLYAPSPIQADRPRPEPLSFITSVQYVEQPDGMIDVEQSTPSTPAPESTLTPSTFGSETAPSPSETEPLPSPSTLETETNSSGSESEESPSSVETAASLNSLFF